MTQQEQLEHLKTIDTLFLEQELARRKEEERIKRLKDHATSLVRSGACYWEPFIGGDDRTTEYCLRFFRHHLSLDPRKIVEIDPPFSFTSQERRVEFLRLVPNIPCKQHFETFNF